MLIFFAKKRKFIHTNKKIKKYNDIIDNKNDLWYLVKASGYGGIGRRARLRI